MNRSSKSRPTKGKDAAESYYRPAADYSLSVEHHLARPTLESGLLEPKCHVHITSHELVRHLSQQSPEATPLADIALAFCQECLGWKNARSINDWGYHYISESVSKNLADTKIPPYERHFHYTHLDKVMTAVRDWLSAMDACEAEAGYEQLLSFGFGDYFAGAQDQAEVCRDLMAACVEAHRSGK